LKQGTNDEGCAVPGGKRQETPFADHYRNFSLGLAMRLSGSSGAVCCGHLPPLFLPPQQSLNAGASDYLYGGWGIDNLDSGEDNDRLFGQSGNDSLKGNAVNDGFWRRAA